MLEKTATNAILKYLKTVPHCFAWKEHGGQYGTAGIPDIICCLDGRFVAFEVKRPKSDGTDGGAKHAEGKLTKLQESTIQRINDAKGNAYKVTTLQEVKDIIQKLESEGERYVGESNGDEHLGKR